MNNSEPKAYQAAVVIGRHQISHVGHEWLKRYALTIAEKVIVVIGSSLQARSPRNPFTWTERTDMILDPLSKQERPRVICVPVRDYYNDRRWNAAVKRLVKKHTLPGDKIALVGHKKEGDASNYYLNHFSDWNLVVIESPFKVDAAVLRKIYFEAKNVDAALSDIGDLVSQPVLQYLKHWSTRKKYTELANEHRIIEAEKAKWQGSPYPVIHSTADALVQVNGHVLLGRRKNHPGKGLWALPGGFVEPEERLLQATLRELREESQISLPDAILLNHLKSVKVFDHPGRSCRGRVITHAHHFKLSSNRLPDVTAADDLAEVAWIPIEQIIPMEDRMFDDHFHILDSFLNLVDDSDC